MFPYTNRKTFFIKWATYPSQNHVVIAYDFMNITINPQQNYQFNDYNTKRFFENAKYLSLICFCWTKAALLYSFSNISNIFY